MEKAKPDTTSTEKTTTPPVVKKLYRLPNEGKIAGVCAGLADYLNMDVTVMRIIFVVLTLASGGFGIIVYIALAVLMPVETGKAKNQSTTNDIGDNIHHIVSEIREDGRAARLRSYFGAALVIFGIWLLLLQFFPEWVSLNWNIVWPTALVILGLLLVVRGRK